jgi:hypothetical protein
MQQTLPTRRSAVRAQCCADAVMARAQRVSELRSEYARAAAAEHEQLRTETRMHLLRCADRGHNGAAAFSALLSDDRAPALRDTPDNQSLSPQSGNSAGVPVSFSAEVA